MASTSDTEGDQPDAQTELLKVGPLKVSLTRLLALVLVLWAATPVVLGLMYSSVGDRGQVGDLFGSVNALFSGLAFAGLFWTVLLQREQLKLQSKQLEMQREELGLQREEMKASREQLTDQAQAQRALVKATVAQVGAVAAQLNVEALKLMVQLEGNPDSRQEYIKQIKTQALAVGTFVDDIKR